MGTGRGFVAALLALALSAIVPAAEPPHIRFAEKITVNPGTTQAQFDAYGRRFVLNLRSNDRALARLRLKQGISISGTRLWRGALDGQAGSWVRLTEREGASEGVIWDGRDLYVVTRYRNVAGSLGVPLAARPDETVIFRLSDATNLLPEAYCGNAPSPDGLAPNNALAQYRNMVAELQVRTQAIAVSTMQIEISMIGDSAFASSFGDPIAQMLASYNIVDGIYAEQLGLVIVPSVVSTVPAAGDPFTSTVPTTLLGQLSTYRQNTPGVAETGVSHLFTGKNLDDDVAGIARLNGACTDSDAVSLTEGWLGTLSSALVMAHELGHNFSADHDGSGACAGVSDDYLMSPTLNGSQQFSQCSINAISSFLAQASCVTPAIYSQVELPQTQIALFGELEVPLIVPFELHSTGSRAVNDVRLDVRMHDSFTLTATTPDVTCAPATPGLSCDVGPIAAGATKLVELTFLPGQSGGFTIEGTVSASNNHNTRNNQQSGSISILNNIDASVSVTTSVPTAMFGDMVDVTLTVSSLRSGTVRNARVGVYGGGLRGESATVPAGVTCEFDAVNAGQTFCIVGDIPGGETRTIVVHSRASQVGNALQGNAYLSVDNDAEYSNNTDYFPMTVAAVHDVGLVDLSSSDPVQFNMPYEYRANVVSFGSQPVDGVRLDINLFMQDTAALEDVSSVTVGGNACTRLANWHYECLVGTMAAGESLPLSIRGVATRLGEVRVGVRAYANVNDNTSNDQTDRGWIVRYGLDVSINYASQMPLVQGREEHSQIAVWSNGTQVANDAVMIVEMPPQVRFTRFDLYNAPTTSCELVDPQHLRCTLDIPPHTSFQSVGYSVISDVPGAYQASATVTLSGDENPNNDRVEFPVNVASAIDVGVRITEELPEYLVVDREVTVPLEVFAGPNSVANVAFNVYTNSGSDLVSMSVSSGSCARIDARRFECELGTLAANATVTASTVVRATGTSGSTSINADVSAPGENGLNPNYASRSMLLAPVGDALLEIDTTAVQATAGTQFDLPAIRIRRVGEVADARLTVTLPAGLTFISLSGSYMICSGTTTLECELPAWWPENQSLQVNLRVNPTVAGSFAVTARVSAVNDFTNANDEGGIAVTVNPAQTAPPVNPPPTSGGGGGSGSKSGGGGRIEWPVTILLGLMLLYRQRRVGLHPSRARLRQKRGL